MPLPVRVGTGEDTLNNLSGIHDTGEVLRERASVPEARPWRLLLGSYFSGQAVTQKGPSGYPEPDMVLCGNDDPTVHEEFEELVGPIGMLQGQLEWDAVRVLAL